MQLVQTRMRLEAPFTRAFTACRLGFQRRRVTLCAWEMLLPNCGPLPQTSHTCAMTRLQPLLKIVPSRGSAGAPRSLLDLCAGARKACSGSCNNAKRSCPSTCCRTHSIARNQFPAKPDYPQREGVESAQPTDGFKRDSVLVGPQIEFKAHAIRVIQ